MPNHGYPDNDGSRDPAGQHDEGRQRVTCYDAERFLHPTTVAQMATNDDPGNNRVLSNGDENVPNHGWKVDGNAGSDHDYTPADYPAFNSMG